MDAITDIKQLDPAQRYTYADYLTWRFPERTELIDGYFRVIPPHLRLHQEVVGNLATAIYPYVRAHKLHAFMAPLDVRLPTAGLADDLICDVVQPDLMVFRSEEQLDEFGGIAPPDWAVEIIQPGNFHHDTRVKFALYERYQVPEYWIVCPHLKTILVYVLVDGQYQLQGEYAEPGAVPVHTLPGLTLDWDEVFENV
ncbi:Uma2 family endonuclease [Hymenobacter gummosus]|uniref:Uma2 family endonuclease n=1 Tax=Hymenobacter gummosus TaxID=1776032 RepID=A0A3S0JI71_9BACT|nr:Uma2 family endonuclease [Hymenobacter gummosus]RTQ50738.1 Uma2 family endonuclease [Hymenobacter gummosus]